mgnify:CR=1 FL=1
MLLGTIEGREIYMINVYAPNVDYSVFVSDLVANVAEHLTTEVIIMGDYNCVLDGSLDRDPPTQGTKNGLTGALI